jgi:hypothetical protein
MSKEKDFITYNCKEGRGFINIYFNSDNSIKRVLFGDSSACFTLNCSYQDLKDAIKEAELARAPENYVISYNQHYILLIAKDQENTMSDIVKACEEDIKKTKDWHIVQSGHEFRFSHEAYGIIKVKNLLRKYFFTENEINHIAEVRKGFKNQEVPIQIYNPEPKFIPMQICPICNGQGQIHNGGNTSALFKQCPKCNGERTIPMIQMEP